ncbi:MAG: hypothetical protein ABH824_07075 [Nanoarchaeota archaeon]
MIKKGQTESFSFLIGVIIMTLILGAITIAVYNFYSFDPTLNCVDDMADKIEKLSLGKKDFVICEVGGDYTLLSFNAESNETIFFSEDRELVDGVYDESDVKRFLKPPKCAENKACICACDNIKKSGEHLVCVGDYKCKNVKPSYVYGAIVVGSEVEQSYNHFVVTEKEGAVSFDLEGTKRGVAVCAFGVCGDSGIYEEFFDSFVEGFEECGSQEKDDCYCEKQVLPEKVEPIIHGKIGYFIPIFFEEGALKAYLVRGYQGIGSAKTAEEAAKVYGWDIIKSEELRKENMCFYALWKESNIFGSSIFESPLIEAIGPDVRTFSFDNPSVFLVEENNLIEDREFYFVKAGGKVCLAVSDGGFDWMKEELKSCSTKPEEETKPLF